MSYFQNFSQKCFLVGLSCIGLNIASPLCSLPPSISRFTPALLKNPTWNQPIQGMRPTGISTTFTASQIPLEQFLGENAKYSHIIFGKAKKHSFGGKFFLSPAPLLALSVIGLTFGPGGKKVLPIIAAGIASTRIFRWVFCSTSLTAIGKYFYTNKKIDPNNQATDKNKN